MASRSTTKSLIMCSGAISATTSRGNPFTPIKGVKGSSSSDLEKAETEALGSNSQLRINPLTSTSRQSIWSQIAQRKQDQIREEKEWRKRYDALKVTDYANPVTGKDLAIKPTKTVFYGSSGIQEVKYE